MTRPLLWAGVVALLATPQALWALPEVKRNIPYSQPTDGVTLELDAYLPDGAGPFPAVLIVHGGGWRSGSKEQLGIHAWFLARAGFAAFAIDYRLAPDHRWPAQIHDCKAAIRWIRTHAAEYQVDPERVGAYGYSAGGHLVALLGTTDESHGLEGADAPDQPSTRVQAVCAGGAPVEFRDLPPQSRAFSFLFGGTRAELPGDYDRASPTAHVSDDDPPIMFFHGSRDVMVPLRNVEAMTKTLKKNGVTAELRVIEGAGHLGAAINPKSVRWAREFFEQHLVGEPGPEGGF